MIVKEFLISDENDTFKRNDIGKVLRWHDDERLFFMYDRNSRLDRMAQKFTYIEIKTNIDVLMPTGLQVEDMAFDLFHYQLKVRKRLILASTKLYDGETCNIPQSWVVELASTWKDLWRELGEDAQAEYTFQAREMIEKMMKSE